jgi:hypothetical protein
MNVARIKNVLYLLPASVVFVLQAFLVLEGVFLNLAELVDLGIISLFSLLTVLLMIGSASSGILLLWLFVLYPEKVNEFKVSKNELTGTSFLISSCLCFIIFLHYIGNFCIGISLGESYFRSDSYFKPELDLFYAFLCVGPLRLVSKLWLDISAKKFYFSLLLVLILCSIYTYYIYTLSIARISS